jgi:N-acetylglutamate synthase-like GNAT family acetyltransferase
MNPALRVRRATTDDLPALKNIWRAMQLPADDLEKRLTEFQVVENADGEVLGAIGIQLSKTQARFHNEGYSDFSIADAARHLFWERIQTLASNHGIFRLWTQEASPFWKNFGFHPANAEIFLRLPDEWKNANEKWLTLELKNEAVINAALKNQFAGFMDDEKKQTARVAAQARTLRTIVTVVCFIIGILGISFAIYLFVERHPFQR